MISQLKYSLVPPVFYPKSTDLQKNPCHSLGIKPRYIATFPYLYHNILKIQTQYSFLSSTIRPRSYISARISRTARTEAQEALCDYLHYTRNLDFVDAEHISKNSPTFVENLLSKVKDDNDIIRSLAKFFRYHPINEFEPFFESLGLTPSELRPLLPRDLMFLGDDDVLLDNFHVLSNYGIPSGKIGRIYKEDPVIFKCDHGILFSKLQAYEQLGLSTSDVIELVIYSPMLLVGGVNEDFCKVLGKLKELGLGSDWIIGNLSDGNTCNWGRMFDMLYFLYQIGCSSNDVLSLFKTHPGLLFIDSGKKFYVLVALLLKIGLTAEGYLSLFLHFPQILTQKFMKKVWELVGFLAEIGMESKDIVKIICTHTMMLDHCSLKKPVSVMYQLNVGPDRLCAIIKDNPLKLIILASKLKMASIRRVRLSSIDQEDLVGKTMFLKSIGYVENSEDIVKALKKLHGSGNQIQERFDCLVNAGIDRHVVSNMIREDPRVLSQSKEKIEMKIQYLVNQLGYPLQSLVLFPRYLCYSINRIKLRFSFYFWLIEEGVAKPMWALSTVLAPSEAKFEICYLTKHPKGPSMWESMKESLASI